MFIESTFDKRCQAIGPPSELSFMTASMSIVFIITNIPGNILVILAVFLDPNKNLRTPFNWLVVNLAIADLIVGVITEPFFVYYHIKEGMKKNRVSEELMTIHMAYFVSCTASVLSLTSLAVERYLAVRKPNTYRNKVTNKRILLTIVMIWLISLSLPNIYFHVGFPNYAFIFANTCNVVAVLIICITYTLMRRKVNNVRSKNTRKLAAPSISPEAINKTRHCQRLSTAITRIAEYEDDVTHSRQSLRTQAATPSTSAKANVVKSPDQNHLPTLNTNLNSSNALSNSKQLLEAKVTEMFLIVLIVLLCCYGPSTIMMYLVNFCENCSCTTLHWFRDVHILFVLMNSSINFFCYSLRCSRFRRAFVKLLRLNRR